MGSGELDFTCLRPAALTLWVLPLILLWLARLRTRPPELATGTFALWQRVSADRPAQARRHRPRVPVSTWLLAGALFLGVAALAGPRFVRAAGPRHWHVLVDHSPSTALAWHAGPAAHPDASAPTRLERALDEALAYLERVAGPADRVRWSSTVRADRVLAAGQRPPAEWFSAPAQGAEPPAAWLDDRPGVLLVSDRPPSEEPVQAGWFASGGGAVFGAVAADAEGLWQWEGEATRLEPYRAGGGLGHIHLGEDAGPLPAPVRSVIQTWAEARGLGLGGERAEARLEVSLRGSGAAASRGPVARDGWWAQAEFAPQGLTLPDDGRAWRPWLLDGEAVLALAAPGELRLALTAMDPPQGDPAAFALSWAELLDGITLPHPDVVPLSERLAAGSPSSRTPRPPPEEPTPGGRWTALPLDAWLAGLAAVLALLGLGLLR